MVIVAEIKRISEENLKNNNNNNKKKNSNLFLDNLSEKVKNLEHLFVLPKKVKGKALVCLNVKWN